MLPRQGRVAVRQTAQKPQQPQYTAYSFPGPSLGWVSDQNLAMSQPAAAYMLDNIFPTATGGVLRRGCEEYNDLGAEPEYDGGPVRSMFAYESGSIGRLFASVDGGIFETTSKGTITLEHALTDGYCATAQYTSTDGTRYVRGVNGVDDAWVYDGATFDTTPALTFAPPFEAKTSSDLNFTWVYKNRFFFLDKDDPVAWYLPVGQIGGELEPFDLGGVFKLGGGLVFGGAWSIEAGDGLNQMCIFATDKGEIAVYAGANPGDANDWQLVGVYSVGKPKGPNAFEYRGGDLAIATDNGLVVLSNALQKDPTQIALSALSSPIENEWRQLSRLRPVDGWNVKVWSSGQMLAVTVPTGSQQDKIWLIANARTNRWARFTGWDATCIAVFNDRLFFGSVDGKVYEAMVGGNDAGLPYTGVYVPVFDQMGAVGRKDVHMVRCVMRSAPQTVEKLGVHADYNPISLTPPDTSPTLPTGQWGGPAWGQIVWGSPEVYKPQSRWRNKSGGGEAVTISHQVTSAGAVPLDTEFIRTDVLFTVGEMQS